MAEPEQPDEKTVKKRKLPLILGVFGALVLGGGGFFAIWSGLLFGPTPEDHATLPTALPDIGFVPIPPAVISLLPGSSSSHLRFAAQLEVEVKETDAVMLILPRIQDVLNSYLRAVTVAELQDPSTLVRIRAQLLRRIQLVAGDGRVRDLLVTEFVLN
ncbi:MAG: flagellar basal body protein FliL [Rhodobacteraceae bacterium PARR1]|nr:MAG: flagellar basal body protein FliL [Rhodobacteraceae bacterium PARR1]